MEAGKLGSREAHVGQRRSAQRGVIRARRLTDGQTEASDERGSFSC